MIYISVIIHNIVKIIFTSKWITVLYTGRYKLAKNFDSNTSQIHTSKASFSSLANIVDKSTVELVFAHYKQYLIEWHLNSTKHTRSMCTIRHTLGTFDRTSNSNKRIEIRLAITTCTFLTINISNDSSHYITMTISTDASNNIINGFHLRRTLVICINSRLNRFVICINSRLNRLVNTSSWFNYINILGSSSSTTLCSLR